MSVKMIFKATPACKALQPIWFDGTVGEVDTLEAKRLLKDYPENYFKYDEAKHGAEAASEIDDDSQVDGDGDGAIVTPLALEDVLVDNDTLLNMLLDNGVTSLAEALDLTNADLKEMGLTVGKERKAAMATIKALEAKPDSDKSEGAPDSTK